MGHVQRTNPMGICCICTKDQPYGDTIEDQSYVTVHVAKCTYAQSQVRVLCQV